MLANTHPANMGLQDVSRTPPSNVHRTSPKDTMWPSRGRPDLTSQGRPNLSSRGRLNLIFKGRPWEVDSGCPRTFSGHSLEDLQSTHTWMSQKKIFNFSFRTYSINQIYLKAIQHSRYIENSMKLLRCSIFSKIS